PAAPLAPYTPRFRSRAARKDGRALSAELKNGVVERAMKLDHLLARRTVEDQLIAVVIAHDALVLVVRQRQRGAVHPVVDAADHRSEEHTAELQSREN